MRTAPCRLLQKALTGTAPSCAAASQSRGLSSISFCGAEDAPAPAGSSSIKLNVQSDGKAVNVSVAAGGAQAKASYSANSLRSLSGSQLVLYDAARTSVAHSAFMEYLLRLSHERYSLLAQFPDFSPMFSKDYYYRSHPEEVRKFYALVDEFHRMWDVVTEFDSLSNLAAQMVPTYRKRHMNVSAGPAAGPNVGDGTVVAYLLSKAA